MPCVYPMPIDDELDEVVEETVVVVEVTEAEEESLYWFWRGRKRRS